MPDADIFCRMNGHDVIDERSLELHGVIARELRADPAKLDLVVAWIRRFLDDPEYSDRGKDALGEWQNCSRVRPGSAMMPAMIPRGTSPGCHAKVMRDFGF